MVASIIRKDDSGSGLIYPGSKGGSGVYQTIINTIPPHDIYIETHIGGGAIMRHKRPAPSGNIGIDIDPEIIDYWRKNPPFSSGFTIKHVDAISFLKSYPFKGNEFVYCDPPYLMETRKGGPLYNFEYTREQHIELLSCIRNIPAMVMISGYKSQLYNDTLWGGWYSKSFEAQTRQGKATEWIWFNYPPPDQLHDYSFLGDSFRDRERIKRKQKRWINKLMKMSAVERNAMLRELNEASGTHSPESESPADISSNIDR